MQILGGYPPPPCMTRNRAKNKTNVISLMYSRQNGANTRFVVKINAQNIRHGSSQGEECKESLITSSTDNKALF